MIFLIGSIDIFGNEVSWQFEAIGTKFIRGLYSQNFHNVYHNTLISAQIGTNFFGTAIKKVFSDIPI